MTMINVALQSNGGIATATDYGEANYPSNANNGSSVSGNGNNWCALTSTSHLMITFNKLYLISKIRLFTTENWGYHFNNFDLYYTTNNSLTATTSLSSFTKIGSFYGDTQEKFYEQSFIPVTAKKIVLVSTTGVPRPAVVEFEVYGIPASKVLIQDGNQVKSTDGTIINYSDNLPYSLDKFNSYGITDIGVINSNIISKLVNNKYKIALYKK